MPQQRSAKGFKTNLQSSLISYKTHEDREWLIAPCVALVPGVLNGDLVTLNAIKQTHQAWNGRPVVLDHPYSDTGDPVSANSPEILRTVGLGQLWNNDVDDDRLRVEAWLDIQKCESLGGDAQRVLENVKSGIPIEVSTGYWATLSAKRGTFKGKVYESVTELIIPDHLALLPNSTGACNWGDGCGIPRAMTEQGDTSQMTLADFANSSHNHADKMIPNMTVTDQFQSLAALIGQEMEREAVEGWRWHLLDIEESFVIIRMDQELKRRPFAMKENGNIELEGEWEVVHQQTTFVPAERTACRCQTLTEMTEHFGQPTSAAAAVETETSIDEDQTLDNPQAELTQQEQVDTLAVFLSEQGVDQQGLMDALESRRARRAEFIETLKANSEMEDADFIGISDAVIEKMAQAIPAQREAAQHAAAIIDNAQPVGGVYAGRGMPAALPAEPSEPLRRQPVLLGKRQASA